MSDINEVRTRLYRLGKIMSDGRMVSSQTALGEIRALLADHARLRARVAELEAPPAIDLEQFRPAVIALRSAGRNRADQGYDRIGPDGQREAAAIIAEADRLLDLIDGSKRGEVKS